MKIFSKNFFLFVTLFAVTIFICSCSGSKKTNLDDLLASVCNDASETIIAVHLDLFRIEADFPNDNKNKVDMPRYLRDALNRYCPGQVAEVVTDVMEDGNISDFVVFSESPGSPRVLAFGANKKDKEKAEFVVKNNLTYVVFTEDSCMTGTNAENYISTLIDKAKLQPLSQWKKDFLTQGDIINILTTSRLLKDTFEDKTMIPGLADVFITGEFVKCSIGLQAQTAIVTIHTADSNGIEVKSEITGHFNPDLLQYAGADDFAAISLCLNEGTATKIAKKTELPLNYLADSGLFISAGFKEGFTVTDFENPDAYHFVMAADLKPDKANEAYTAACKLISMTFASLGTPSNSEGFKCVIFKIPYNTFFDYSTGEWASKYMNLRVGLDGNILVVSNGPILKDSGNIFDSRVFSNNALTLQVIANAETVNLLQQFGLVDTQGLNVTLTSDNDMSKLEIIATGTTERFLPAVFEFLSKFGL